MKFTIKDFFSKCDQISRKLVNDQIRRKLLDGKHWNLTKFSIRVFHFHKSERFSELCQTSKLKLFATIINSWKPLFLQKAQLRSLTGFWIPFCRLQTSKNSWGVVFFKIFALKVFNKSFKFSLTQRTLDHTWFGFFRFGKGNSLITFFHIFKHILKYLLTLIHRMVTHVRT